MIPVQPQPEPMASTGYDFRHDVYERGEDAIRQLAGFPASRRWPRNYPYWQRAIDGLHTAYGGYCAYLARYIEPVEIPTTDHFVALRNASDPMLAYTWSNLRLAHGFINGVKAAIPDVLDPFEIGPGWFAIDFGTFETVVGPEAPPDRIDAISTTIRRLKLDSRVVASTRRRAAELYWCPPPGGQPLPFWSLEQDEPFLAGELRRQGLLNSSDLAAT